MQDDPGDAVRRRGVEAWKHHLERDSLEWTNGSPAIKVDSRWSRLFRSGTHAVTFARRTLPIPRRIVVAAHGRDRTRGVARFLSSTTSQAQEIRTREVR